jgi:hypothetical protein
MELGNNSNNIVNTGPQGMKLGERKHNMSNVEVGERTIVSVWVEKEKHEQTIVEKGGREKEG